jgi:hypothetical protein
MAYDSRNSTAQGLVNFLTQHAVFSEIADFEHNAVPAKSSLWISFKALADATDKFSTVAGKQLEMGDVEAIWQAWLLLSAVDDIRHGTNQESTSAITSSSTP